MESGKQPHVSVSPSTPTDGEPKPAARNDSSPLVHTSQTWDPSPFQVRPLAGLLALGIAFFCLFASLGLLLASDGQFIDSWPIQPAVYLAIIAAITNTALQIARAQALPIDWWYSAYQGSTLKELERRWEAGDSLVSAILLSNRHISKASIASVALALFIIDGVLLQRASTTGLALQSTQQTLRIMQSPEVPTGYAGFLRDYIFHPNHDAVNIVNDWVHNHPINIDVTGCDGVCSATVRGPGMVKQNCTTRTWPITSEILQNPNASWGTWKGVDSSQIKGLVFNVLPLFEINLLALGDKGQPDGAFLKVGRMNYFDLEGEYIQESCYLVPAILDYDISIEDRQVTLGAHDFVDFANNTAAIKQNGGGSLTLYTFTTYVGMRVITNVTTLMQVPPAPHEIWEQNTLSYNAEALKHANLSNGFSDSNFLDPMPTIISYFNELMFRGGISTAAWSNLTDLIDPGLSSKQIVQAQQLKKEPITRSDLRWWAGAAVLDLLTILVVLPLFNHWWSFDRSRTLSPLELAVAFDAPLVREVPSAGGADGAIRQIGDVRVRFGAVVRTDNLAENTETPGFGEGRFSENRNRSVQSHLGIGKVENVIALTKGSNVVA